jgi:Fe-S-cluster-containing dehydrogenase component/CRP-like cAMP-binding protein
MGNPDPAPARSPHGTGAAAPPEGSRVPDPVSGMRIPRPKRWSVPFSERMTDGDVQTLFTNPAFSGIDASRFPPRLPLHGVLKNDTKLRSFEKGDIIVREGDYGNSAFLILYGSVRVVLDSLPARILGRQTPIKKTLFGSIAQLWRNSKIPEERTVAANTLELESRMTRAKLRTGRESRPHVFVEDLNHVLPAHEAVILKEGELFGEIAAIGRTPRTTTVLAEGDVELLEIRWQGLRELRLFAPAWKEHIDRVYRQRALFSHLRETPVLSFLTAEQITALAAQTQFETFGNFDWTSSFQKLSSASGRERVEHEPLIAREGDYPNGLILIRSGNVRLSMAYNHGERTISYLGKGRCFGLEEILHNSRRSPPLPLRHSLRAIGYVDVLVIPTSVFESVVLPTLTPDRLRALGVVEAEPGYQAPGKAGDAAAKIGPDMLEFMVENRFINGTATMLIDMDRCTRCDDCVRACAATHDGNPRFIRQGPVVDSVMVANACMHCVDPVCMIGCPTGAISRESIQGQIVINDSTCIGCAACATSCPYQNIHMVQIRDQLGEFILDETTHTPIAKATKCDFCVEQIGGPACVNACPHDAMVRADMSDVDLLSGWINR